ncbi:SOS response-associated peptidase (plasmid) [Arthrobacter sp. FW305-123]|nr:SOS response-associated peptidase [Arthrobacter sp. FW305-123]
MPVPAPRTPNKPAEGYIEWQKTEDGKKIPNYLFSENEPRLGFAGLYEFCPDPELTEDDPERWMWPCETASLRGRTLFV